MQLPGAGLSGCGPEMLHCRKILEMLHRSMYILLIKKPQPP